VLQRGWGELGGAGWGCSLVEDNGSIRAVALAKPVKPLAMTEINWFDMDFRLLTSSLVAMSGG
jgi:hypothetical protein